MKRWFLIPLLSLAISTQSFAQTSTGYQREQILLTYEQFAQLTHTEQKTYVKKLREIMIEVAKAYPEMAEEMSAQSTFYAQFMNIMMNDATAADDSSEARKKGQVENETRAAFVRYANQQAADYMSEVEKAKTSKMTDTSRGQLAAQYREALYWSSASARYTYAITDEGMRKTLLAEIKPNKEKIERNEDKVKQAVGESEYRQARDDYFKKAHNGELMPNTPYPEKTLIDFGERLPASATKAPGTQKDEPAAKPEVKPEPKKEEPKKEEKKPEPKKEEKKVDKKDELPPAEKKTEPAKPAEKAPAPKPAEAATGVLYRCMYSGFVIKNHPCMAPSQLPWDLKGLDTTTFACKNGTVMCNPFLFGFKTSCDWSKATDEKGAQACYEKAQPFCVKPGLYATKNCGEASNSDSALEAAVHLIHNNATAFNLYSNSFGDLCQRGLINVNSYPGQSKPRNEARTRADIERTCTNARVRMKEIIRRYGIFKESQPKKSVGPAAGKELNTAK